MIGSIKGDFRISRISETKIDKQTTFVCCCTSCGTESLRTLSSLNRSKNPKCMVCSKGDGISSKERYTYESYRNMMLRCYNDNYEHYDKYGGRGITVCDEWKRSFGTFMVDMGSRPNKHSLDRIDVNLGYSKDNCRWTTQSVQIRNRGKTKSKYSNFRGVSYDKAKDKWVAFICFDNKTKQLGRHTTELEAAESYNLEALELGMSDYFLNTRFK